MGRSPSLENPRLLTHSLSLLSLLQELSRTLYVYVAVLNVDQNYNPFSESGLAKAKVYRCTVIALGCVTLFTS